MKPLKLIYTITSYLPAVWLAVIIIFMLSLGACKKDKTDTPPIVPPPDSTKNISAFVGDTIEIKILNTAYDGGYLWNVTTSFDPTIAQYKNYTTEYTGDSVHVGAATYEIWNYVAIKSGVSTMQLKLYRPWEPANIIENKSYILTVN